MAPPCCAKQKSATPKRLKKMVKINSQKAFLSLIFILI